MKELKIILIPIILFIFVFAILFAYLVMPKNNSIRESNFPCLSTKYVLNVAKCSQIIS